MRGIEESLENEEFKKASEAMKYYIEDVAENHPEFTKSLTIYLNTFAECYRTNKSFYIGIAMKYVNVSFLLNTFVAALSLLMMSLPKTNRIMYVYYSAILLCLGLNYYFYIKNSKRIS